MRTSPGERERTQDVVALIVGTAPGGHQVVAVAWTIQVLVLVGALLLLASRISRRS